MFQVCDSRPYPESKSLFYKKTRLLLEVALLYANLSYPPVNST